jgi:signal transduction histidine kinase
VKNNVRGSLAAIGLLVGFTTVVSAAESPPARRIVILTGAEVMLPANQAEDSAIRRVISEGGAGPLEFYSEGLDAYRFQSQDYEAQFLSYLDRKYGEKEPALVFALTEMALEFLTKYRQVLWPDAPVVFLNVDSKFFDNRPRPSWATGIYDEEDYAGTVNLARRLQPNARKILVVGGAAERDVSTTERITKSLEPLRPDFEIAQRLGVPVEDFPREFGRLTDDTIVLYTMMFRDSQGRSIVPRNAVKALSAASPAPVYGWHSTFLGLGILGGALFDYNKCGEAGGELGLRILRGEAPSAIPPLHGSPALLAVDGRQLKRFGIPARRVPEGAEIRFRPPSFLEQYWKRVLAVGVALFLETVLLIALLVERGQRRKAEDESRQRRRELAHAGRLTAVGELTASISHEINQPLGAILANAEAAEMLLDGSEGSIEEVRRILADIRKDDLRASEVVRRVRSLAGKREVEMGPIDGNALVTSVARLLEYEAKRQNVTVEKDLAENLPDVRGDEVSLQQVLINLALNGIEAMDGHPAGRRKLLIQTRPAGGHVEIRVSDSGQGISDAHREKLFQSFFTTKAHGVGLGLSICRSIIEAHGGSIVAANNREHGATFSVTLPVHETRSRAGEEISERLEFRA